RAHALRLATRTPRARVRPPPPPPRFPSPTLSRSTTLRAISGLLPVRAGRIEFDGARLDGLGSAQIVARGIAHVPEGRQLFPTMRSEEHTSELQSRGQLVCRLLL